MTPAILFDFINLFCAGILAGTLFIIEYGVGPAILTIQDDASQVRMRQALILGLRIIVPIILVTTVLSGVAIMLLNGFDTVFILRAGGMVALLGCFLLALLGTAPINAAVLEWQPAAPPKNWQSMVSRWRRWDIARTWAAVAAFVLFLLTLGLKLVA